MSIKEVRNIQLRIRKCIEASSLLLSTKSCVSRDVDYQRARGRIRNRVVLRRRRLKREWTGERERVVAPPSLPPFLRPGWDAASRLSSSEGHYYPPTHLFLAFYFYFFSAAFFAAVPRSVSMHFVTDTVVAETFL